MRHLIRITCFVLLPVSGLASEAPLPVSPVTRNGVASVATPSPTFIWTPVPEAGGYELVIYGIVDGDPAGDPVLRQILPPGATAWVPSADRGLGPEGTYAWMIRVLGEGGGGVWSQANLFEITSPPGPRDVEEALEVLRRHLEAEGAPADLLRHLQQTPSTPVSSTVGEPPPGGTPSSSASGPSIPGSALALGSDGVSHLLGTTGEAALDLQVAGARALRLEPARSAVSVDVTPNLVGGASINEAMSGVIGATIAGGGVDLVTPFGSNPQPNRVTGDLGTIGGGSNNTAGDSDTSTGTGSWATVGGGDSNRAEGDHSAVGGGFGNVATGASSTVPGGSDNIAGGVNSFAAGRRAHAKHHGTFVWGDTSSSSFFLSTAPDQFLVRAAGGVGIGTASPDAPLDVLGGNWDLVDTEGDLKIGDDTYRLKIGVAIGGAGAGDARIHSHGGTGRILFGSAGTNVLAVSSADGVHPATDNMYTLGKGDRRWQAVHAVNGTIQTSDLRLKSDVEALGYGLAEVLRLRPVRFRWRDEPTTEPHLGLLAQDVAAVLPEVVVRPEEPDGFLGLRYTDLIPVLVGAIQEQQRLIEGQQVRIGEQQRLIEELRAGVAAGLRGNPGALAEAGPSSDDP